MTSIRSIVHNRKIDVPAPDDLPDGTEVVVEVTPATEKIGLNESEWDDSPEGIAAWIEWLDTIEPITFATPHSFDEEFRRFNIEAVRKQMEESDL